MPKLSNSKIVNFPCDRIFQAILDIKSYPGILRFICDIKILGKTDSIITARVWVGLSMLAFSYDCSIEYEENTAIRIRLISGPFKRLTALWQFESLNAGQTRIDYQLDSEFKNKLMEITAGAVFAAQLDASIAAFEDFLSRS